MIYFSQSQLLLAKSNENRTTSRKALYDCLLFISVAGAAMINESNSEQDVRTGQSNTGYRSEPEMYDLVENRHEINNGTMQRYSTDYSNSVPSNNINSASPMIDKTQPRKFYGTDSSHPILHHGAIPKVKKHSIQSSSSESGCSSQVTNSFSIV